MSVSGGAYRRAMAASKTARARAKQREKRRERRRRRELAGILGHDGPIRGRPPGVARMSEVLIAFAEPILDSLDDDASLDEYGSALRFASVIWNVLTMLDEEHRRSGGVLVDQSRVAELTSLLEEAVGGFDDESVALLDALRDRRTALFPEDRRIITEVSAEQQGDRVHVVAASASL